jgi:diaminopimelate decarboxylase
VDFLAFEQGSLHAEDVPLEAIAARFGTPCFVYSRTALAGAMAGFTRAIAGRDALVCYAMKANSTLAILDLFARAGAGFDIVSGGELARALAAGGDSRKIVFSGVGKTAAEMRAALAADILAFNVESAGELRRLEDVARELGRRARVSVRVNPDVDPQTHPYISTGLHENKFGVPFAVAQEMYRYAAASAHLDVVGVDCHIGSQIVALDPFVAALDLVLAFVDRLAAEGIRVHHLDVGGGLGIRYAEETPPAIEDYVRAVFDRVGKRALQVLFEPGRVLVGNAGLLLTRVEYLKDTPARNFAVVDAAMNDLIRPALYQAHHDVVAVRASGAPLRRYEVVGPVCESGDFLAHERDLAIAPGDLLAVLSAGAYAMSMSSNYNSRPRAAEVMVDGSAVHLIRAREDVADLFRGERRLP